MILFQIFNDPTINYAAYTWNKGQAQHEATINAGHRRATKCALGTGWRPNHPNYVGDEARCRRLNVLPIKLRQNVLSAGLTAKLLRGETLTPSSLTINNALYISRERDRHVPPLFAPNSIPKNTPIGRITQSLEKLKFNIDIFGESLFTIKRKLRKNATDNFISSF